VGPSARADPLLLRPWTGDDAPALREAIDDDLDHLKPWLTWTLAEPAGLDRARELLDAWRAEHEEGNAVRYAVVPAPRPSVILGDVHLVRRGGPDPDDVGYWVRGSATRRGIASAAVARLVVSAFEDRGRGRLGLHCDVANSASAAFARTLGFRRLGPGTMSYPDGAPRPVIRFAMTRDDYQGLAGELKDRARRVRLTSA
jgi:RimJ/RimL family protein N-acetyltransferase